MELPPDPNAAPTRALIHTGRVGYNLRLLRAYAKDAALWPVIKANAYSHDAHLLARYLSAVGYHNFCVANPSEAIQLIAQGISARYLVMSPQPIDEATEIVSHDLEAVVCTRDQVDALSRAAGAQEREAAVHILVDTGMARAGVKSSEFEDFAAYCDMLAGIRVAGVMSHFARADEADQAYSLTQTASFRQLHMRYHESLNCAWHLANSAGMMALPDALFDAVRPGIAMYGLNPFSASLSDTVAAGLKPVMEVHTRITHLAEVMAGTGISYGHRYQSDQDALIATVPIGYGDGLSRALSDNIDMLVNGHRCPQVGSITMDQSLLDVSALRGQVTVGDNVVVIGQQGGESISADELAARANTINYEIVTAISARVPRIEIGES